MTKHNYSYIPRPEWIPLRDAKLRQEFTPPRFYFADGTHITVNPWWDPETPGAQHRYVFQTARALCEDGRYRVVQLRRNGKYLIQAHVKIRGKTVHGWITAESGINGEYIGIRFLPNPNTKHATRIADMAKEKKTCN